jgi:ketosteroid isomerase-like protein
VSEETLVLARRAYELYASGEAKRAVRECFCADAVLVRRPIAGGEPEAYEGHEGLLRAREEATADFSEYRMEPERFFDLDDRMVVHVRVAGTDPETGVEAQAAAAHLIHFRDGLIGRWEVFLDLQEALDAAGWSEGAGRVHWARAR